MKLKNSVMSILKGAAIGIACIVPGVSGGTLAVILGIYDDILRAVSNIRKEFKKSFYFLLPIILGIVIGLAAMVVPLQLAFKHFPLPTVTLFVGFIIGGLPSLLHKVDRKPTLGGSLTFVISLGVAVGLCFIGAGRDVVLGQNMEWWLYLALVGIGVLGSAALTVPGISGSMLLLILGFYEPILGVAKDLLSFTNIGISILILFLFALGVLIGFFLISKLMTFLLKKVPYITYMGIIGFILGSIFSIFYSIKDNVIPSGANTGLTIALTVIAALLGLGLSGYLSYYSIKKRKEREKLESLKKEDLDETR